MAKKPRPSAPVPDPARSHSWEALEEMLETQRMMLEVGAELSLLVSQLRSNPENRVAIHEQLDELMTTLAAFAEQVKTLNERYRQTK
jgi:uncharacterized coiled-coil DUF342 family protein